MRVEQPLAIEEVSSGLYFEEYFPRVSFVLLRMSPDAVLLGKAV
jgi:hypothetical protein